MPAHKSQLDRISGRSRDLIGLLGRWLEINSQTHNSTGLEQMLALLESSFRRLGGRAESVEVGSIETLDAEGKVVKRPLGRALRISRRAEARLRVLLCGHMDTVLEPSGDPRRSAEGRTWGVGAADAKGGLAVMLAALECLEESPVARKIGWDVLIVPDEEIGSPKSKPLLEEAAKQCHLGLVFEPALPDGALVGERPGSGNFIATFRGRTAHAGRNPETGANAIQALTDFVVSLRQLEQSRRGEVRINVGAVQGGGPVNVVPDFALCRFNIRVKTPEGMDWAHQALTGIRQRVGRQEGISVEINGTFGRHPKILDARTLHLLKSLAACGRDLNLSIQWRPSGGVCDGNILASAGLPNVDTLGPVGDGIHTPNEYVVESTIVERARLVALLLMRLAGKEISWLAGTE